MPPPPSRTNSPPLLFDERRDRRNRNMMRSLQTAEYSTLFEAFGHPSGFFKVNEFDKVDSSCDSDSDEVYEAFEQAVGRQNEERPLKPRKRAEQGDLELKLNCFPEFARIRCVKEALSAIFKHQPLPEPLCYCPKTVKYRLCHDKNFPLESGSFMFFEAPSHSESKFESTCDVLFYQLENRNLTTDPIELIVSALEIENDQGTWLEVVEAKMWWPSGLPSPVFFLLHPKGAAPSAWLVPATPQEKHSLIFGTKIEEQHSSWKDVVELSYGCGLKSRKLVAEPFSKLVDCMSMLPVPHWTRQHDEKLIMFLSEQPEAKLHTMRCGSLLSYVEKITFSSSIDYEAVSVKNISDENPVTYWESSEAGPHSIKLQLYDNIIVKDLYIVIDSADQDMCPSEVHLKGNEVVDGKKSYTYPKHICNTFIEPHDTGEICIMRQNTRRWSTLVIDIPEMQKDGTDVRIHGIRITPSSTVQLHPRQGDDLDRSVFDSLYEPAGTAGDADLQLLRSVPRDALYWRAVALRRVIKLFESDLERLIPRHELSIGSHDTLFQQARILFPLCSKPKTLITKLLTESSDLDCGSPPTLRIDRTEASHFPKDAQKSVFMQIYRGLQNYDRKNRTKPLTYSTQPRHSTKRCSG